MSGRAQVSERLAFVESLERFGDQVAVHEAGGRLTYRELAERVGLEAARLAAPVGDGGASSGRRLVLLQPRNDVASLAAYLGALAGGHAVMLAPPGPLAAEGLIAQYDPDVVVTAGGGACSLDERRPGSRHDLHPDLALLLSTSGTTGSPKLCRLSADNLQANAEAVAESLAIRPDDRAITSLPMHYCYGLSVVHSHLSRGAALVLTEDSVVDESFWDDMRRHRVTTLAGVPYTFDLLDRMGFAERDLPDLRCVTQAGGRLAPDRVASYAALGRSRGWDLFVMYGQTEATARMAVLPPHLAEANPGAIGCPIPGGAFRLEPTPAAAPFGEGVGELVYSGPNVMLGYAERAADLALGRTVAELRTGDLARIGEDGLVEVVGRLSSFLKIAGLRVDLGQVEALLRSRGITACAGGDDQTLDIAVEAGPGLSSEAARGPSSEAARARALVADSICLPTHAIRVAEVPGIPRLPNGKPDRAAAREAVAAQHAVGPLGDPQHAAPGADRLIALFAELLGRPDADRESTFVGLGGDSLSYIEVSLRLEDELGTLPANWHTTPIGELATAQRPGPRERGASRGRLVAAETTVALRAAAIVAVVGTHADLFTLRGGAHLLLGLAGYNFARFGLTDESARTRLARAGRSIARIAVPSVLWIAAMAVVTGDYTLANVFLVNAAIGPESWGPEWHFWFIEAAVWILVAVTALLSIPVMTRWQRAAPFGFALALAALGLLPRFDLITVGTGQERGTAQYIFWIFALGWAAAAATRSWQRLLVSAAMVCCVPGFFNDGARDAVVVLGLLALVWVPFVRVPRPLASVLGVLASSSLYIYLTQWQVYPLFERPWLALLASLAAGAAFWVAAGRAQRLAAASRARLWGPLWARLTDPVQRRSPAPDPVVLMKETL